MKKIILSALVLSLTCVSSLRSEGADLVKTCQEFKKSFLEACQIIGDDKYTDAMKFIHTNLMSGGSVVFFEVIITAIDDCIKLLTPYTDARSQYLIGALNSFKGQINSDETYDLNACSVFKKETLRSGNARLKQVPYNATRCYKVARPVDMPS